MADSTAPNVGNFVRFVRPGNAASQVPPTTPHPYVWASDHPSPSNGRDPQTVAAYGQPYAREMAYLLFHFGSMPLGSVVKSFRFMQRVGQLSDAEAISMIGQTVSNYCDAYAINSPEVWVARSASEAWATAEGFGNFEAAENFETPDDRTPDQLTKIHEHRMALGWAFLTYEARLLRECDEEGLADFLLQWTEKYRTIVTNGEKSLITPEEVVMLEPRNGIETPIYPFLGGPV